MLLSRRHEISVFKNICTVGLCTLGDLSTVQTGSLGGGGGRLRQMLGTFIPHCYLQVTHSCTALHVRYCCSFPKICQSLTIESS